MPWSRRFPGPLVRGGILLLTVMTTMLSAADTITFLREVRRIVVLGDSITQDGNWVADLECGLLAQGVHAEVLDLGLSSETASDLTAEENAGHGTRYGFPRPALSERLARVLTATTPEVVIACYGMNDGSSLPANDSGTQRFAAALQALQAACVQAGVRHVVFMSPPVHECPADQWHTNTHDDNLTRYSAWLVQQRAHGWTVVDVHTPMRAALDTARATQPTFGFTHDGTHPEREGHWVMAQAVLTHWLGLSTAALPQAEALLPRHGHEVRAVVRERQAVLAAAWMTRIGHQRPHVAGGPNSTPGLPLEAAAARAAALTARITALLAP